MFEPDEEGDTGMRVKQPLASFLAKFKQVHSLGSSFLLCPGNLGAWRQLCHCTSSWIISLANSLECDALKTTGFSDMQKVSASDTVKCMTRGIIQI